MAEFSSISFPGPSHRIAPPPSSTRRLLRCGRLFDSVSMTLQGEMDVLVEGELIKKVGARGSIEYDPKSTEVIDLSTYTVMPGLVDCHAHILIEANDYQIMHLQQSSAYKALRGLKVVQEMLRCGWTTVRMAGDADVHYANIEVRRMIDNGVFQGPRLVGAGHYISATGGGGDMNQLAPECKGCSPDGKIADGCDAIRLAVREEVKYGSDWIKCLVTGAFMAAGNNPNILHWSDEEMKALVEEASRLGRPVMAHAHSAEGIKQAVRCGVRSIEHGTYIDDEALRMMIEKKTFLVPTLFIGEYYRRRGTQAGTPGLIGQDSTTQEVACMQRALASQVRVAVGTDYCGWEKIEWNVKELQLLHAHGLSPSRVLQAATAGGADLLNLGDKIGRIKDGFMADVIAVAGDPLRDLAVMEKVSFVMKSGNIVSTSK